MLNAAKLKEFFDEVDVGKLGQITYAEVYENLITRYGYKCPEGFSASRFCLKEDNPPKDFKMDYHRLLAFMEKKSPSLHCMAMMRKCLESIDPEKKGYLKRDDFDETMLKIKNHLKKMNHNSASTPFIQDYDDEKVLEELDKIIENKEPPGATVNIENFLSYFWKEDMF